MSCSCFICLLISKLFSTGTESAVSDVTFTRYDETVNWDTAKSRCEALGERLAVLDTAEKLSALQEQM